MAKTLVMLAVLLAMVGCTNDGGAQKTLSDQGYTEIKLTGYRPFICGDDYTFSTGFAAKSIAGKQVTGAVCSGWLKGSAIKVD